MNIPAFEPPPTRNGAKYWIKICAQCHETFTVTKRAQRLRENYGRIASGIGGVAAAARPRGTRGV